MMSRHQLYRGTTRPFKATNDSPGATRRCGLLLMCFHKAA
jgi:hypothetical protein